MTYDVKQFDKKAKANNLKCTKVTEAASLLILQKVASCAKIESAFCYYTINKTNSVR
jgi:hypothetical protein